MTIETRPARRDPILLTWLGLSVALNVTGMASLVEGVVTWADFIGQIIAVYRAVIREPMQWIAQLIWPTSWPRIPAAAFDLIVVWSCLFLSANIAVYRAAGIFLLSDAFARIRGVRSLFQFLLVATVTFAATPLEILRLLFTPNEYRYNPLFPYRREMTYSILYSVLFVIGVFVLVLFINYQIKRIGLRAA